MTFEQWASQQFADGEHTFRELPLDLLHPLRHGPFAVTCTVAGGVITDCRFDVSHAHRGDERLLEVRDLRQGLALVNRHSWLTAAFAETLYARIAESMLGLQVPARALALRQLSMALNSEATNALWNYLDASLIGDASDGLVRRDHALVEWETLTGARMHPTYVRIGGVAHDIDAVQLDRLHNDDNPEIAEAARHVAATDGPIHTALPKVVRLPHGEQYAEIETPHGVLGMWIISRGDKVPHRVHLRTAGFRSMADLEREAIGSSTAAFLMRLARTRLVLGEVAR